MAKNELPVVFVLGPSGSGKSTFGGWINEDLGFLHLEIDRYPEGDGIDLEKLRAEWDRFWTETDARALAKTLRARAVEAQASGVVASFPSGVVPTMQHLSAAAAAGIQVVVLYGTGADCLDAFLERERSIGRFLGAEHWIRHNSSAYAAFSYPFFRQQRLLTFEGGRFRSRADLMAEVTKRFAAIRQ